MPRRVQRLHSGHGDITDPGQLTHVSCGATSVLLKTTMSGSFILYRIEHAYSMLDMNVTAFWQRGVSTTYTTHVGIVDASDELWCCWWR